MRIFSFTLMLLLLFACKNNKDNLLYLEMSYGEILKSYRSDINELKIQNINLIKKNNASMLTDMNDITLEYFSYLDSIQNLCIENQNPFFNKGKRAETTQIGNEFIEKTTDYLTKLNNNLQNNHLKKRASLLLNVDDIKYDDEWFIIYIDYHFRGVSCMTFRFLIENRKRNVLIIQNEILYSALLEQCKVVN